MNAEESIKQVSSWIGAGEHKKFLFAPPPHSMVEAKSDPIFQQAIHDGSKTGKMDLPEEINRLCTDVLCDYLL